MIEDYATLKTEIGEYLNRGDLEDKIPGFIQLAEAALRRKLRVFSEVEDATVSSRIHELPDDCVELRSITYRDDQYRFPITIASPETVAGFDTSVAGRPTHAFAIGNRLYFNREPADEYAVELLYYSTLASLSDENTTTTLLTQSPDLYLFGALREAEAYLINDERVPLWNAKFLEALADEEAQRSNQEFGASLRPMRLPVVF